jgi:hypothetical protein
MRWVVAVLLVVLVVSGVRADYFGQMSFTDACCYEFMDRVMTLKVVLYGQGHPCSYTRKLSYDIQEAYQYGDKSQRKMQWNKAVQACPAAARKFYSK